MIFIPRKYFDSVRHMLFTPDGHRLWIRMIWRGLTNDDMDTMLENIHDSDSAKDWNPLYYLAGRPQNTTLQNPGKIFNKREYQSKSTSHKITVEFVVTRFNEDLSWLDVFRHNKITVYEGNIGTFLMHIVSQYDNLPDFTIFLHGNPFNHGPLNLIPMLYTYTAAAGKYVKEPLRRMFKLYYKDILGKEFEHSYTIFVPGAQYVVHNSCILKRPKAFWKDLYERNLRMSHHTLNGVFEPGTIDAWTLERIIPYLLDENHHKKHDDCEVHE